MPCNCNPVPCGTAPIIPCSVSVTTGGFRTLVFEPHACRVLDKARQAIAFRVKEAALWAAHALPEESLHEEWRAVKLFLLAEAEGAVHCFATPAVLDAWLGELDREASYCNFQYKPFSAPTKIICN